MRTARLLTIHPVVLGASAPPPHMQTPPGCRPPWSCDLWCMLGSHPPPHEQNDWQTCIKTLPCPKLRLRAVIIHFTSIKIITVQTYAVTVEYLRRPPLSTWTDCQFDTSTPTDRIDTLFSTLIATPADGYIMSPTSLSTTRPVYGFNLPPPPTSLVMPPHGNTGVSVRSLSSQDKALFTRNEI